MQEKKLKICLVMCNGQSKRFEQAGYKQPKYLLRHPTAVSSLEIIDFEAAHEGFLTFVAMSKKEFDKTNGEIKNFWPQGTKDKLILMEPTKSHVESCVQAAKKLKMKLGLDKDPEIIFRDCDALFKLPSLPENIENCVFTVDSKDYPETIHENKGKLDENGKYIGKNKEAGKYIAGGYYFKSLDHFLSLDLTNIKAMGETQDKWEMQNVQYYVDIGDPKSFWKYTRSFQTLFVDMDGTLFKQSSSKDKGFYEAEPLKKNIEYLNALYAEGRTEIIVTTGRPVAIAERTKAQLNKAGLKYDILLCGVYNAKRIILNDVTDSTDQSAAGINVMRDKDGMAANFLDSYLSNMEKADGDREENWR